MSYFEFSDGIAPLLSSENPDSSVREERSHREWQYKNVPPSLPPVNERENVIPGRGDLRISLTTACNLKCDYCHNEGREAPWRREKASTSLDNIEKLLDVAARYGVRSVKFSGGDPGVYSGLLKLMEAIAGWREGYPGISKWGLSTNGVPFLDARKFRALVASRLDNLSIGIDSVESGELSKPSSPVGIPGQILIDGFVMPLLAEWGKRAIKFDTVFTGEKLRTLNVVRMARKLGINASVVEINGVMGTTHTATPHTVRSSFLELIDETADEFGLRAQRYEELNEIYLFDDKGNTPIKFYQDHCLDRDCGNCRKIHLRVSPTAQGWGAVPCFLRAQSKTIPLMVDGNFSAERLEDAIRYNGRGPQWFKDTAYDPSH